MAFDFASRDFDTIKRDLLARANKVLPEWTDRDPSDFGMLLLDLWAHVGDVAHFYIDRAAGEAFLNTAQQRESVLALANLFDYTPRGRTSGQATLTLVNQTSDDYTVPALTQFVARYDDVTYQVYTREGGLIPALSTGSIQVLEGELFTDETLTSSATGTNGQRYTLVNDDVVTSSLAVYVYEDGVTPTQYQRVERLTSAATGERVFTGNITADGATEVVFGSNLNGFVPPPGALIKATYSDSSGIDGNLPANKVVGWRNSAPSGVGVQSSSAFAGGVDEESITSLKRSIPSVISAQNRAVTRNDFIRLAQQVEGVAKATIEFVPGAGGASAGGNASVTVYPQTQRGDYLTTGDTDQAVSATIQAAVVAALQPRAMLGVDVLVANTIDWQPIDVTAEVFVNERYVNNWVRTAVEAAIDELFAFDNVFFGQRLTLGQLYRIILNVPGVDYCTVAVFDLQGDTDQEQSITVDELVLPKKGDITLTMTGGITTS